MKKICLLLLVFILSVSVFAEASSDVNLLLGAQVSKKAEGEGAVNIDSFSLMLSETAYYYKDNEFSAPILKVNLGAGMIPPAQEGEKPSFCFTAEALGGYSIGIGPMLKVDLAGGISFSESSIINFVIKKMAKEEYKISYSVAPVLDASAFFGLENVSVRAGLKGMYGLENQTLGKPGLSVTPYVGISVKVLQALNIL